MKVFLLLFTFLDTNMNSKQQTLFSIKEIGHTTDIK